MGHDVRKWTNRVLEAMDEGVLDPKEVAAMCMQYMSEWDVEDMCRCNDLAECLGEEAEDEEPDVDELTEWHDFDPDC
jgi:hypothetical protein